jgi:hypothetical protein
MKHIIVTIEGPNFEDVEEADVIALPEQGEAIETKYGTCLVTSVEPATGSGHYQGRVVCRLP